MSLRTPLARVQGLGAAHSGPMRFWQERVSAVALIPLTVWFAYAALYLVGANRDAVMVFLAHPLNAVLTILFILATVIHMTLGIQVVIEDYVHAEGAKITLLLLNRGFGWLIGALCIFAMLKIAL